MVISICLSVLLGRGFLTGFGINKIVHSSYAHNQGFVTMAIIASVHDTVNGFITLKKILIKKITAL